MPVREKMPLMRRLLLLLVVACAATASPASADATCRNKIYDDWYKDGKIASTYPIACYRDAIKNVHGDAEIYSSLVDDIRAAMQAAISRGNGAVSVPEQVGKGLPTPPPTNPDDVLVDSKTTSTESTPRQVDDDTSTVASAPVGDTDDGGGIPVPLLVLGGLALALAAAGGLGLLARRRRPGDPV